MASKKVIIGAVVLIAIIAVAAIAIGGGSSDDTPEARYNYKIELADSFAWTGESGTAYTEHPDAGKQYAILTYKAVNDSYDDGISTNALIWEWKVIIDGVSYTCDFDTFSHPGYQLVTAGVGGTATQCMVFQIPTTVALGDITVSQEYRSLDAPRLQHDATIVI